MGTRRKALLALMGVVCLAVIAAAFYLLSSPGEGERAVIETVGVVEATEVELSAKAAGRIEWLCCVEGDAIKAGAVAVRLESVEPGARLEEARAALAGARASLDEARTGAESAIAQGEAASFELKASEADKRRLEAMESESGMNLDRARALFKEGYISKREMDSAEADYEAKRASVSSAEARVKASEAGVRAAEAALKAARARISALGARAAQAEAEAKVEESRLRDTEISAPMDAVVAYRAFEPGEVAAPGASIYTLHVLEDLWARIDVEETEIGRLRLGSPAEVRAAGDALTVFDGEVAEVGPVASFATQRDVTRGRADIRTFRVKVRVLKPSGALKPGMTVNVKILPSTDQP
jgi:HlyD family secretion protein